MTSRALIVKQVARLAILVGLGWAAYHFRRELARSAADLKDLDPLVLLVIPLFALWNYVGALAWLALHRALTSGTIPGAWRLSLIRLQAQALNLVLPLASVGGDIFRAGMLSRLSKGQVASSTSAVVLDKVSDGAAGVAFSLLGIAIGIAALRDGSFIVVILSIILVGVLAFLPVALRIFGARISSSQNRFARALIPIAQDPRGVTLAFYRSTGYHFLERLLTGVEIYLAMLAAGLAVNPLDAIFVSALMTAYTLVFFFIPGQLGAAEAGVVSGFASLGLSASLGLTVALVRRARQVLIILGGALLFLLSDQDRPLSPATAEQDNERAAPSVSVEP